MTEGEFLWKLIAVLTAVGNLVAIGIAVWAVRRRQQPIPEELYKDFLAKADHDAMCESVKKRMDALDGHNSETHRQIFDTIRLNQASLQEDFKTLERGLGRVEGKLDHAMKGDT